MAVSIKIEKLRKCLNLTQHEFADKAGIDRGNLANYEKGNKLPEFITLCKIASACKVDIEYFVNKHEPKEAIEFALLKPLINRIRKLSDQKDIVSFLNKAIDAFEMKDKYDKKESHDEHEIQLEDIDDQKVADSRALKVI
jgi:transcriptional regulator with XRE-family HTH domain